MRLTSSKDLMPPAMRSAGSPGPSSSRSRSGNGGCRFAPFVVEALPLPSDRHLELGGPGPAAVHGEVQRQLVQLLDGQVAAGQCGVDVGVHGRRRRRRRSRTRWSRTAGRGRSAPDGSRRRRRGGCARRVSSGVSSSGGVGHHHGAVELVDCSRSAFRGRRRVTLHAFERGVGGGEERRVVEAGVVDEDADVLGQQLAGECGEAVEVEAASGDDVGGVAAAAPAGQDRSPRRSGRAVGRRRSSKTSAASASWAANTVLLRTLTSWPAPSGPTCRTGSPKVSRTGRHRSTASVGPPTITSSSPAAALWPPPLTGASTMCSAGESSWSRRHVVGVDGAVHDDDRSVGHRGERAVGASQDLVDAGVVDDADAEHVGRRAELCGRSRRSTAAGVGERLERLGSAGPQRGRDSRRRRSVGPSGRPGCRGRRNRCGS